MGRLDTPAVDEQTPKATDGPPVRRRNVLIVGFVGVNVLIAIASLVILSQLNSNDADPADEELRYWKEEARQRQAEIQRLEAESSALLYSIHGEFDDLQSESRPAESPPAKSPSQPAGTTPSTPASDTRSNRAP